MLKRDCPVCGGVNSTVLYENVLEALAELDLSYTLSRCRSCGFHYASNLPEEQQYSRYYGKLSKYDSQASVSSLDTQRINATVAFVAKQSIAKESRILDIGCGFGALLSAFRDAGWVDLIGLDPAPRSAVQAKEQFGLDTVYRGDLSQCAQRVDLTKIDLVCLMAVLEHLPALKRDLEFLISQLRPGTKILVEVPALELFQPDAGEPYGELSLEHIQFFSRQSLRNLFHRLGATVVAEELVPLETWYSGALLMLAVLDPVQSNDLRRGGVIEEGQIMDAYLQGSALRWAKARARVPDKGQFLLYGAGSHSARLLPTLSPDQRSRLVAVFDGNRNLHGKTLGPWLVQHPRELANYPSLPVLVSSYRSERAIVNDFSQKFQNSFIQMYQ
jgi:2-polyprenyl-3-methyl-5-hydroxy-6-metoxy-1,4-benzoquinol methylase